MCTYLQLHQGTYHFRRGVPAEMQHLFPTATGELRTAWRWSLGVKNREEAKRLLPGCAAKTDLWMDQARKAIAAAEREVALAPTDAQLASSQALADQMLRDSLEAAEFFAGQDSADETRAELDADFAQSLELRAVRGMEIRRLREAGENRELIGQARSALKLGPLELFDKYAAIPGRTAKTVAQRRPYPGGHKLGPLDAVGSDHHLPEDRFPIAGATPIPAKAHIQIIDSSDPCPPAGCQRQKEDDRSRCMVRSRGGLTTKIHAPVDALGLPIGLKLTEGQVLDGRSAADMLDGLGEGDVRAYDSDAMRIDACRTQRLDLRESDAGPSPRATTNAPITISPQFNSRLSGYRCGKTSRWPRATSPQAVQASA